MLLYNGGQKVNEAPILWRDIAINIAYPPCWDFLSPPPVDAAGTIRLSPSKSSRITRCRVIYGSMQDLHTQQLRKMKRAQKVRAAHVCIRPHGVQHEECRL